MINANKTNSINVGDIVVINDKGNHFMVGMVVKTYPDIPYKFFVRSIRDNFDNKDKDGWTRYGVEKRNGIFINKNTINSKGLVIKKLSTTAPCIIRKMTYTTNTWKNVRVTTSETYLVSPKEKYYEANRTSVMKVYQFEDKYSSVTFVLLPEKNVGGFAVGTGEGAIKMAALRAERQWINIFENEV